MTDLQTWNTPFVVVLEHCMESETESQALADELASEIHTYLSLQNKELKTMRNINNLSR